MRLHYLQPPRPALVFFRLIAAETFQINGKSLDIWSLGITLYCFVHGYCPFEDDDILGLYEKIMHDAIVYKVGISAELLDLLQKMLHRDPEERITILQIKEHPWTTTLGSQIMISTNENCVDSIEAYSESTRAHKPVMKFVSKVNKF